MYISRAVEGDGNNVNGKTQKTRKNREKRTKIFNLLIREVISMLLLSEFFHFFFFPLLLVILSSDFCDSWVYEIWDSRWGVEPDQSICL